MNLKKYIKIYYSYWKLGFKYSTIYRADAVMLLLGVVIALALNTVFFKFVYNSNIVVEGWEYSEIILLIGIFQTNWGFSKMFYGRKMEEVIDKIFTGHFDYNLLKPINLRFYSFFLGVIFKGIPSIIVGIIFIYWGINVTHSTHSFASFVLLALYCICGQIIAYSFQELAVSASFFTERSDDLYSLVEDAYLHGRYPKEAFSKLGGFILTYLVPIMTIGAIPAGIFLNKYEINLYSIFIPVTTALSFLLVSKKVFSFGLLKYTSATS